MIETDLGCVTAYADAVAQGYTGTREEFGQVLANFADSATQVATDRTAVEAAKKTVEEMQSDVTQKQETAASNMKTAVEAAEKKTFADVPERIKDKVKEVLTDLDCPELAE